jgi:hypothetical protein
MEPWVVEDDFWTGRPSSHAIFIVVLEAEQSPLAKYLFYALSKRDAALDNG